MNYKSFPPDYWTEIENLISQLKSSQKKLIAAFDADGTLWDTDLGENFFQYQIDNKLIPLPHDPWDHYLKMKAKNNDPRSAYLWLAQVNNDLPEQKIQTWATQAFQQIQPNPIFSEQKKLIQILLQNQVEVYIVTASIKWAVQPGAVALGLSPENVIGIETEVRNGHITENPILPITYRQGKVDALLKHTNGISPFLASGNTMGDFELLMSATHIKLAVSAAVRDDKIFKTENELQKIAQEKNWWAHRFI